MHIHCDICIATDLTLAGGNKSTTLEELNFLDAHSKLKHPHFKIALVHVPKNNNMHKAIDSGYSQYQNITHHMKDLTALNCQLLIVRHPLSIVSNALKEHLNKINCNQSVFIINQSIYYSNKKNTYALEALVQAINAIASKNKVIFPVSPVIRKELLSLGFKLNQGLSSFDWSPAFDDAHFIFSPKLSMRPPFKIGFHSRNNIEKFIENKTQLLAVYAENKAFEVIFLGGGECAKHIVGYQPKNWQCLPFGSINAVDYLKMLDVFVYYPNTQLNEAFGRTIVEAMLCGVPCVLPPNFKQTFNQLAFYANPENASAVIKRLAENNQLRHLFLTNVHAQAQALYGLKSLENRFSFYLNGAFATENSRLVLNQAFSSELMAYKTWVETGA